MTTYFNSLELWDAYYSLKLQSMADTQPSLYPQLPNDSSLDEEVPHLLQTTAEERQYV